MTFVLYLCSCSLLIQDFFQLVNVESCCGFLISFSLSRLVLTTIFTLIILFLLPVWKVLRMLSYFFLPAFVSYNEVDFIFSSSVKGLPCPLSVGVTEECVSYECVALLFPLSLSLSSTILG